MAFALNPKLQCPALCCWNPPTQIDTVLSKFLKIHRRDVDLVTILPRNAMEKGIYSLEQLRDVLAKISKLCSTRVLINQDENDMIASVCEAEWLAARLGCNLAAIWATMVLFQIETLFTLPLH
jgi:phosphoglycerate-specific signal transduction histidine kinase